MSAKAKVNIAAMAYNADIKADRLNIGHYLKGMSIGAFTGTASFSGQGTDILSSKTWAKAEAEIRHFDFSRYNLNGIKASVLLKEGRAKADIDAHNKLIDGKINLDALLNPKKLDATLMTELAYIDLYNLYLVDKPLKVSVWTQCPTSATTISYRVR